MDQHASSYSQFDLGAPQQVVSRFFADLATPVAVLLSTYNGARFLPEQLDSLLAQTHRRWVVFWRDDGSTDGTKAIMRAFAAGPGNGRCVEIGDAQRLGPTRSFLATLATALDGGFEAFAFADQDDVWLPEKLARGVRTLEQADWGLPALYCARQVFVNEALQPIGISSRVRRAPAFPAALTQNIATGCTMLMNRQAAELVARSRAPQASLHDWWTYLLVTAAGGAVFTDDTPAVLYRQHDGNLVGAPKSPFRRGVAALRRGPSVFMNVFRQQVIALAEQPDLLTASARADVRVVAAALRGSARDRLRVLRRARGLRRQTWPETLVFGAWFLLG